MRRGVAVGVSTLAVIAAAGGGWYAGRQVESPADAAARVAPPAPGRITVPVEQRVLASTLISRGNVRYGEPKPITLAASALSGTNALVTQPAEKGAAIEEGTKVLEVGGRPVFAFEGAIPTYRDLRPGDDGVDVRQLEDALARLGHDPGVIDGTYDAATEAAVESLYRASGYEAFGPTEAQRTQLQQAREAASRARDQVLSAARALDQATKPSASRRLTAAEQARAAREKAAAARGETETAIARAESAVEARQAALDQARTGVETATAALAKTERDALDTSPIEDAESAAVDARAALADADAQVASARRALDEARAALPSAERQAELSLALDNARAILTDAQLGLADAQAALATAQQKEANPGFVCDPGQPICSVPPDQLEQLRQARRQAEASVRSAQAQVRQAETGVRQAESAIEQAGSAVVSRADALATAERARERAARALEKATDAIPRASTAVGDRRLAVDDARARLQQAEAQVAQAERDLAEARANVVTVRRTQVGAERSADAQVDIADVSERELYSSPEAITLRAQLVSAQASASRANADLADLERQIGLALPAREVLFFAGLPLRVDEVRALRGDPTTGSVITVSNARLAVDSSVDAPDAQLLRVGMDAEIDAEDLAITYPVRISKVANRPGTDGVDTTKVFVELTIVEQPDVNPVELAERLNGLNVRVTIPVRTTDTEVLAVPIAALSVGGDGTSRVEVETAPDAPTRFVRVTPGLSAEGYVAVTPAPGQELAAGVLVVVGTSTPDDLTAEPGPEDQPGAGLSDEPVAEEPVADEPVSEEPGSDEPAADDTATDESGVDESAVDETSGDS